MTTVSKLYLVMSALWIVTACANAAIGYWWLVALNLVTSGLFATAFVFEMKSTSR